MPDTKDTSGTIVIKKYANRRLYDTSRSTYVTLDHLSGLVKRTIDFEVVDAKTGENITRQVLTQIILEKEAAGEGALPVNFLRKLISFYGDGPHNLLSVWLEMSMDCFTENWKKGEKAMGNNPFVFLEKQTQANMKLFEQSVRFFTPDSAQSPQTEKNSTTTGDDQENKDPFNVLRMQMQAFQERLDALSGKR